MADTKISALAQAGALTGGEALPAVQNGATTRVSAGQLAALARAQAVEAVPFATAVPLDGRKAMAQQLVAGPLAFSLAAAPVLGASCTARLIADGAHTPAFPAGVFAEHGSSAGFLNVAGAVNLVEFWHDGVTTWFAVNQAANVSPFAAASGYVPATAPASAVLTYPYALASGPPPAGSAFAVTASGSPVTATAATVAGRTATLALSRPIASGEAVNVAYAPPQANPLLDSNGNAVVASALGLAVGVLPADQHYLRFAGLVRESEAANPVGGWSYAGQGTGGYGSPGIAQGGGTLAAGADGWIVATNATAITNGGYMFGFATGASVNAYQDLSYGLFCDATYSANYGVMIGGGLSGAVNGTAFVPAAGDLCRIGRWSGTLLFELSRDGGASWTTIHNFGAIAGALRPAIVCATDAANGVIDRPRASANVA